MDRYKVCRRCEEEKAVFEFGKLKRTKDRLALWCRGCMSEYSKERHKNPEIKAKHNAATKKWANDPKNKEKIFLYFEELNNSPKHKAYVKEMRLKRRDVPGFKEKEAKRKKQYLSLPGNLDKQRARVKKWDSKSENKVKKADTLRFSRYGLSPDEYLAKLESQSRKCNCCGDDLVPGRKTHIDHKHIEGYRGLSAELKKSYVRGILCENCNCGIGHLNESTVVINKAIGYLARPHTNHKYGDHWRQSNPNGYNDLFQKASGACEICERKNEEVSRGLFLDHSSSTGCIRGLLCVNCNAGIGKAKDSTERLRCFIAYLTKWSPPDSGGFGER
jgi:hypothetical protein